MEVLIASSLQKATELNQGKKPKNQNIVLILMEGYGKVFLQTEILN